MHSVLRDMHSVLQSPNGTLAKMCRPSIRPLDESSIGLGKAYRILITLQHEYLGF